MAVLKRTVGLRSTKVKRAQNIKRKSKDSTAAKRGGGTDEHFIEWVLSRAYTQTNYSPLKILYKKNTKATLFIISRNKRYGRINMHIL